MILKKKWIKHEKDYETINIDYESNNNKLLII